MKEPASIVPSATSEDVGSPIESSEDSGLQKSHADFDLETPNKVFENITETITQEIENIVATVSPECDKNLALEVSEDGDHDTTIHGFNASNITVIERQLDILDIKDTSKPLHEGSDSGVETIEPPENPEYHRALSANSQDQDPGARSCDSSIISCCSNYEEAYNILVRKNSTLLEDYTLRNGDVTSENGSESSSVSGKNVSVRCTRRGNLSAAKKTQKCDNKVKLGGAGTPKDRASRSNTKPPITPASRLSASTTSTRLKSVERVQTSSRNSTPNSRLSTSQTRTRPTPNSLDINKRETKRVSSAKLTPGSASRTSTQPTPSDDGRWPSIHSRPAPLMTRSLKGTLLDQTMKPKLTQLESKTIEQYATLPRRKKEKTTDSQSKKSSSRENTTTTTHSLTRSYVASQKSSKDDSIPSKMFSSLYLPKSQKHNKTKIYHEMNVQTALTMCDIDKALNGRPVSPKSPTETEKSSKDVQVDITAVDFVKLQAQLKEITEKYEVLCIEHKSQTEKLNETETQLKQEQIEKEGLREELTNNSQRVLAILGQQEEGSSEQSDSLMVLETRFQNVSQVIIQQEEEITRLNNCCRSLHLDLEKSLAAQKTLLQQHQDLEAESIELQEFMQAEKTTLTDALKEAENEIKKHQVVISEKDTALAEAQEEVKQLTRLCDQRRIENLGLLARIGSLEAKSRELLVHQGSSVSGASVAISSLIERLSGLVEELIAAYSISDQELEDMIYHNEAYTNPSSSSVESTPERSRPNSNLPSPKDKGSSFVSAVINAIRNAATGRDARNACQDRTSSNEMLDSETEPCLMMEHVLEDVVIPDGYSHNMISSGHGSMLSSRLTHSESLKDVSNAIFNRQASAPNSLSYCGSLNSSFHSDMHTMSEMRDVFPSFSLVDQVIEVDNVITRLLKVIRIIQIENDDCMNELQDQRDTLADQIDKQRETNKVVVKQLKDWEVLGARLKTEIKELMNQLTRKNVDIENLKMELNEKREQVQKQNQDVCELSTALAKAELEMRLKDEEVEEQLKKWTEDGEFPSKHVIGRLLDLQNEVPMLKEKLSEKEKRLNELSQEFLASKQVMTESLKEALNESKRQYEAIDGALEVLQNIQTVVQQCPPLSKLQRELEEVSFKTASNIPLSLPPDCNANAGLLQNGGIEGVPTINTTA